MVVTPMLAIASMRNTTIQFAGFDINPQLMKRSGKVSASCLHLLEHLRDEAEQHITESGHKHNSEPILESPRKKHPVH